MHSITVDKAKEDLQNLINITLDNEDLVNIVSDKGNVILLNKTNFNNIMLTLDVYKNQEFKDSLIQNMNNLDEFVDESEVEW